MIKGVADLYIHVQAHISPRFARPGHTERSAPRTNLPRISRNGKMRVRSMLRDLNLDLLDVDFST